MISTFYTLRRAGIFAFAAFTIISSATAQPSVDKPTYENGFTAASRIGNELYNALKPQYRKEVHVQPVALETDLRPFVKTEEYPDENKPLRLVFISVGFLDLINNIAHAKAIDKTEPGYFERYLISLAEESGDTEIKGLPGISAKRYWTEDVLNEQTSNFNQMVGIVIAIEISHHYFDHFKKYGDKLETGDLPKPINNMLSDSEWNESVKAGVQNALDCGYGVEGVKALYEAIDKMPKRPSWTAYFLPENAKVAKLKKDLERAEKDYFGQK